MRYPLNTWADYHVTSSLSAIHFHNLLTLMQKDRKITEIVRLFNRKDFVIESIELQTDITSCARNDDLQGRRVEYKPLR